MVKIIFCGLRFILWFEVYFVANVQYVHHDQSYWGMKGPHSITPYFVPIAIP